MNINFTYIESIAQGDKSFIESLVKAFADDCKKAEHELKSALEDMNLKEISHIAHRSKSTFRNFGLNEYAEVLHDIENKARINESVSVEVEQITLFLHEIMAECKAFLKTKVIV